MLTHIQHILYLLAVFGMPVISALLVPGGVPLITVKKTSKETLSPSSETSSSVMVSPLLSWNPHTAWMISGHSTLQTTLHSPVQLEHVVPGPLLYELPVLTQQSLGDVAVKLVPAQPNEV